MQTIFINIKCELGKAYAVADSLVQDVDEVSEVHSTSDHYDLLVKAYLADDSDIGHFINERIHSVNGVVDTFTTIAFKAFT